jgi:hypothetical protein
MSSTTFVNYTTPIPAEWLNDVNTTTYGRPAGTFTTVNTTGVVTVNVGTLGTQPVGSFDSLFNLNGSSEIALNATSGPVVGLYYNGTRNGRLVAGSVSSSIYGPDDSSAHITLNGLGAGSPGAIRMYPNSVETMRLYDGGHVSIGNNPTDNGVDVLQVNGSANINAQTAIPAGGATAAGIKLSSVANFGIYFGSGVPTLTVPQGSLYLRTDGNSTSTRMYINTNGGSSWTPVTTAA